MNVTRLGRIKEGQARGLAIEQRSPIMKKLSITQIVCTGGALTGNG
jgi:hypothetical protein